jgi:periplasmic divalent cation tolerance protein
MTKFIEVITTFDSVGEARKMAKAVIENRLGGCCSIQGIESYYRWEGKIEITSECQLTIKTAEKLYPKLEKYILENHTYETPQIISLPILNISKSYNDWLEKELQ